MPFFKFIGDPAHKGHGPDEVQMFGHIFTRDAWTEVTNETAALKLMAHTHFAKAKPENDGEPKPAQVAQPALEPEALPVPAAASEEPPAKPENDGEPKPAWPDDDE
jgi:hypothetical protein